MSNLLQTHNVTILTRRKAHTQSMQASIQIKVKQIARSNQIKVEEAIVWSMKTLFLL
jgi:hypothetical protein